MKRSGIKRKGVCKRDVVCPDCGYTRNVYADRDELRCRACTAKSKRNRTLVICPGCGIEHYLTPSAIGKGIRYCTIACANAHFPRTATPESRRNGSKAKRGAANPNWKHGKRAGDSSRLFGIRLKDEGNCRNCGATGLLHLHHIIPRSMFAAGRLELLNGVPLCPACHVGWHRRCAVIHRDIFTEEEWAYLSSVTLLGQNIEAWLDDRYPPRAKELAA
jgi:5-methylcytosine-specific restriction endonuclease McrA